MSDMATVGYLRENGYGSVIVICGNAPKCHHHTTISIDGWPTEQEIPTMGRNMRCQKCGHLGAETRPDYSERALDSRLVTGNGAPTRP